jgi:serine/threonine-protein kinase
MDERFRGRFEGEIEALLKLEHENIVRLLSYGQDDGNLFFAMELVDGNSLFEEQKKGTVFHWREIIEIGQQVCRGLRHAHERGIIHRDLKPGNLMIDRDRRIKITDFGIAKSFGSSAITSEGNVVGTMDYMSPEQARGEPVTARSDIFSLGAVFYALLAGRPPFLRDSMEKTFGALLSAQPPERLERIATDTPRPLAALIHRLLEKDPSRRIATALALGRQLEAVEEEVRNSIDHDTEVLTAEAREGIVAGSTFASTGPAAAPVTRTSSGVLPVADAGLAETAVGSRLHETAQPRAKPQDYFNQVTPQQRWRGVASQSATAKPVRGIATTLLALLAVVGLSALGVWLALFRSLNPDELLATIRASENSPKQVLREMQTFLEHWPDHEEADYVREVLDHANALRFRQTLALRERLPNQQLTAIESQFLRITDIEADDAPEAAEQMKRFLSAYRDTSRLSENDARAIENARIFAKRLNELATRQQQLGRENIAELLHQAERATSSEDQLAIHRFIIDLYGKDAWAEELLEHSRAEIERLEKLPINPSDPSDLSDQ